MSAVRIEQGSANADMLEMHIRTQAQSLLTKAGRPAELPTYADALEILAARPTYNFDNSPPSTTEAGRQVQLRSVK